MAKQSTVKEFLKFLFGERKETEKKDISAQTAILLQKEYIDNLEKDKTSEYTPPYLEIAKQLNNNKPEIFRAAVYYLAEIAKNERRYISPVINILQECKKTKKCTPEDLNYLNFHLNKLYEQNNKD